MKTLPLLSILLMLSACADNHKANKLISEYVKKHANDPASYEAVSFGGARPLTYGDVSAGKPDASVLQGAALIEHAFRAKNSFGALTLQKEAFSVDSVQGKVQPLREMQDSLNAFTKRLVEKQASEMEHAMDSMADARNSKR